MDAGIGVARLFFTLKQCSEVESKTEVVNPKRSSELNFLVVPTPFYCSVAGTKRHHGIYNKWKINKQVKSSMAMPAFYNYSIITEHWVPYLLNQFHTNRVQGRSTVGMDSGHLERKVWHIYSYLTSSFLFYPFKVICRSAEMRITLVLCTVACELRFRLRIDFVIAAKQWTGRFWQRKKVNKLPIPNALICYLSHNILQYWRPCVCHGERQQIDKEWPSKKYSTMYQSLCWRHHGIIVGRWIKGIDCQW